MADTALPSQDTASQSAAASDPVISGGFVTSGVTLAITPGTLGLDVTVLSGGALIVETSGTRISTTDNGGEDIVAFGGFAGSTNIVGGIEIVVGGAATSGADMAFGGVEAVVGGARSPQEPA